MHTIAERKVARSDYHAHDTLGRLKVQDWGCALLGFGVVPGFLLGRLGRVVGSGISEQAAVGGEIAGWILGTVLFSVLMLVSWRQRTEKKRFLAAGIVQEIYVESSRCFEVPVFNSDPVLAFDLGADRLLILYGQWLYDAEIYGVDAPRDDPEEATLNGLPMPHGFPNTRFTLVRRPDTGEVLAIRPAGEYLPTEAMAETESVAQGLLPSQLATGSSDNLAEILGKGR